MLATRLAPVLVVAVTLALFAPIVGHEFVVWDDADFVYANPNLFPTTLERVARLWTEPNALTNTTYVLLSAFPTTGTIDPRAVHATSLLLHAASALVVWALLLRLVGDPIAAATGALLFAVHPVQVESVAWATGLKDVLSGFFGLLALRSWVRGTSAFGTLWLVLALLAKPTAVVVPVMAAILDLTVLERDWRTTLRRLAPWLAAAVVFGVLVIVGQADALRDPQPDWARPLIALDALAFYVRTIVAPISLGPDYGRTPEVVVGLGWPHVIGLVVAAAVAAGLVVRARRPWLTASVGLFVAGFLPVLGLTPFLYQRYSTVADRYCYLAMLGPALATATLVARHRRPATLALAAGVLGVFAVRSALLVGVWHDSLALLQHGIRVNPRSWGMYENLGNVYADRQQRDQAIAAFEQARAIRDTASISYNLGTVLMEQQRVDEAVAAWTRALELDPGYALAHYNLGSVLAERGQIDAAEAHFQDAVESAPEFTAAHQALRQIAEWRRTQGEKAAGTP